MTKSRFIILDRENVTINIGNMVLTNNNAL